MKLSPIVQHLLLLNVVIFIAMMVLPSQYNWVYNDYFSLHKPNLLPMRTTVLIDGQTYYIPSGLELNDGTVMTSENSQDIVDQAPNLRQQIKGMGSSLSANAFHPVQIVTHFFTHSKTSLFHIIFNMFVLASFGPIVEMVIGSQRFLRFYLFCGVVGGIMIALLDPSPTPVVGASGAIFGVMVAFAMFFPREKLQIMFIPIGFEARKFIPAIGIISAVLVVLQYFGINVGGSISHFGHLAGMVAAGLYFYVEKNLPFGPKSG